MADGEEEEEDTVVDRLIPESTTCDGEGSGEQQPQEESDLITPNLFIWTLTLTAGISGLLFGYEWDPFPRTASNGVLKLFHSTGVISSTLVSIGADLGRPLTILDMSLITSCTSLCALAASPVAGILADRVGRKTVILVADILFVGGALWQAITSSVLGMIVGRSVVGLAVGGASLLVPMYVT